jgi:hypothetical protein
MDYHITASQITLAFLQSALSVTGNGSTVVTQRTDGVRSPSFYRGRRVPQQMQAAFTSDSMYKRTTKSTTAVQPLLLGKELQSMIWVCG